MSKTTTRHSARNTHAPETVEVRMLDIDSVRPSEQNPRKHFDDETLQELARSIAAFGVLEPIIVRAVSVDDELNTTYEIIAGERRYRASKLAERKTIPAVVRELDDRTAAEIRLVENLQRQDLDPIEEAQGYADLIALGYTQQQVGEAVHRAQPTIANRLRLLKLPGSVLERISSGDLTPSHGIALCKHAEQPLLVEALAATPGLTVTDIEEALPADREIPWRTAQSMREAGQMVSLYSGFAHEFRETCAACPLSALLVVGNSRYCLRPDHYRELEAQVKKARELARESAVAEAVKEAGGKEIVQLKGLAYGTYARFEQGRKPSACKREECPHYVMAIADYDGAVPGRTCMDTKCFNKLKAADDKAAKVKLCESLYKEIDRVTSAPKTAARAKRSVAWLAAHCLYNVPLTTRREVAKRFPEGSAVRTALEAQQLAHSEASVASALLEVPMALEIAVLAVELLARGGVDQHLKDGYSPVPKDLIEFYCAEDAPRACRVCGCTDDRACVGADGIPCHWVAADLCSACEAIMDGEEDQYDE